MRPILWVAVGAAAMFIILRVMAGKSTSTSGTFAAFKSLSKTQQASNLIRTNEFRELIRTSEFRTLVRTLAEDQLVTMAKTLSGVSIQK